MSTLGGEKFLDAADAQDFKAVKVVYKEETHGMGPVWLVDAAGRFRNASDSDITDFTGGRVPNWYRRTSAKRIADSLKVPLEEC